MSNRLAVDQPTRGADRNQALADQADPATDDMLLPSLDDGITLLDVEGDRGVPILQSLVLDHLLLHDGPAFWVDANGHATTTTLAQIAPSQRLLYRIHVARGFTAYQHYGAVCDLPTAVNQSIQESTDDTGMHDRQSTGRDEHASPQTPSLIVAPAVDAQYRGDDTLSESHAATLQARTLARLATYADGYDVPVLVHSEHGRRVHGAGRDGRRSPSRVQANPNGTAVRRQRVRDACLSRRRRRVLPFNSERVPPLTAGVNRVYSCEEPPCYCWS